MQLCSFCCPSKFSCCQGQIIIKESLEPACLILTQVLFPLSVSQWITSLLLFQSGTQGWSSAGDRNHEFTDVLMVLDYGRENTEINWKSMFKIIPSFRQSYTESTLFLYSWFNANTRVNSNVDMIMESSFIHLWGFNLTACFKTE